MRACDIKPGEIYRLKSSPRYGYIKVLCVLKPGQSLDYKDFDGDWRHDENKNKRIIVKCLRSIDKTFVFGFVRSFAPSEIIKLEDEHA